MADIFFSTLDRKQIYKLPVLPEEMPELSQSSSNEEFETFNNGVYNFMGNVGLVSFSIDSWLPAYPNKYKWVKSQIDPYLLINMWRKANLKKEPLRVIINRNKNDFLPTELLNWIVTIESISWHEKNNNDIAYNVSLKQYRVIE
ncbi:hypothetical protein [Clostridium oceanicum]|uniref:Phage portal protein n=1 Tax=Clostridium oceanicum TaxID=1543 RepID=A0ABN1JD66_9CLOT